ncbi:MAG: APC family permease [Thermodesulfobacteriota bacterium]|nr:APC family permease [Thermodesulfobacteriota bacterium]
MEKQRSLGVWAAASLGIGSMVGAGIFSIFGTASHIAGNAVYVSFGLAGLIILFTVYSYAKLSMRFPSAGGPVEYIAVGLGENVVTGAVHIILWFGYIIGIALFAKGFSNYASTFPIFQSELSFWKLVLEHAVIIFFLFLNFLGSKILGRTELYIVVFKVGILFLFAISGAIVADFRMLSPEKFPEINAIIYCISIVYLAYMGFGVITTSAEDIKDPRVNLPRALYLSVIIVLVIYILVSIAVLGNLSVPEIIKAKDYVLAEASRPILGHAGFVAIVITAMISTASAINAYLYGGGHVCAVMAEKRQLPRFMAKALSSEGSYGLLFTGLLAIFFINFSDLSEIAVLGAATFMIVYIAVNISHLKLTGKTGANRGMIVIALITSILAFLALMIYSYEASPKSLVVILVMCLLSVGFEGVFRVMLKKSVTRDST